MTGRLLFVTRNPLVTLLLVIAAVLVIPLSCSIATGSRDVDPHPSAPVPTTVLPTCAMFCEVGR